VEARTSQKFNLVDFGFAFESIAHGQFVRP